MTTRQDHAVTTPHPGRYEIGVTGYRGLAGRYRDLSVEVQCVRK